MLRRVSTSLRLRALDVRDRIAGRADRLVPPRRLDFVGHSDFVETGEEFLGHLQERAGLGPQDRVLDVGCGIGRIARPLTRALDPARGGRYLGFDVNPAGIGWCRRHYAGCDGFEFVLADLYNQRYHPGGAARAAEYRFPAEDGEFTLAVMTSVATHLLPEECEHYLGEAGRALAPGGRLLSTWFLLDDVSRAAIAAGDAGLDFLDPGEDVAVVDESMPEEAVAYARGWMEDAMGRAGLRVVSVAPGTWTGRPDGVSFQDLVVAERG